MPCFKPFKAFRSAKPNEAGRYPLTGNPLKARNSTNPLVIPCGQCNGCLLDKSEEWAVRCYHESQMHAANSFLTLTYDDTHLPDDYSVSVRTFQLFMKRLRDFLRGKPIRFFACGEYGDETLRPHYHALIFGEDFSADRQLYKVQRGTHLYQSTLLNKAWPYGSALIGDVTYGSAAYVARYIMKKIKTGPEADRHYLRTHPKTGLTVKVEPEFALQSRMPGLGTSWFHKFKSDAFPSDFIVIDGKFHGVPKFYDKKLQEDELAAIKRVRKRKSLKHKSNNTPERLAVREEVTARRIALLKRELK